MGELDELEEGGPDRAPPRSGRPAPTHGHDHARGAARAEEAACRADADRRRVLRRRSTPSHDSSSMTCCCGWRRATTSVSGAPSPSARHFATFPPPLPRLIAPDHEGGAFGVVRAEQAPTPLARDARSLRHPRLGGDAAADPGRSRDLALARGSSAGRPQQALAAAIAGRRDRRVAGARLQPAGASIAPRRERIAANGWPEDLTELPGRRPVHRRRGRQLRIRTSHELPVDTNVLRVQERTGARSTRLRAGALRPRRDGMPRPRSPLWQLPARGALPSRGSRYEPLRKQGAFDARSGSVARSRCVRSRPAIGPPTARLVRRSLATVSSCYATERRSCPLGRSTRRRRPIARARAGR